MKKSLYILLFLISYTVFSQQKTIEITNIKTGKVKVFKENQRIKIRTLDRKKYIGKLIILDNLNFTVNNKRVKIDSLQSIKNQPKGLATVKTIVLVAGLSTVATSLVAASKGNDAAFLLFTAGAGATIFSGVLEGLNANHSKFNWRFKIIEK